MVDFESFEPANQEAVRAFQSSIRFALPADYRRFLEQYNGGKFKGALFRVPVLQTDEALDVLFGLNFGIDHPKRSLDLSFWQIEMAGEVPEQSIIIGSDPGGNFLVLDDEGVYYYDHVHYYPQSSVERNAYKVASSFTEFLNLLRPPIEL
jgi:hypothetical protein